MLTIDKVPEYRKLDKHLWADYVELHCILNKDSEYTGSDLADDMFATIKDMITVFDAPDEASDDEDTPLLRDKDELFISDVFRVIQYRSKTYDKIYPFKVTSEKITLHKSRSEMQQLYLYLLICSHLRFIKRSDWKTLTSDFELVSYYALKKCLPSQATVRIFGTSTSLARPHYTGKTFKKIEQLAHDLSETLLAKETDFAATASKDKGIDLVAWIPFKDNQNSRLVCFGQCKCSDEWPELRFSSSQSQWKNYINFNNPLNNFSFIPYCYRRTGGEWFDKSSIGDTIVIDRQRIVELINEMGSSFKFSDLESAKLLSIWISKPETLSF